MHQPSLLKLDIPRMPEVYYYSGPNPNLARFVEVNITPYDPAADTYEVPTFDQPITTTKTTAIYNMNTYWSKKPYDAIQQYIRHYTQPSELEDYDYPTEAIEHVRRHIPAIRENAALR